MKKILLKLIRAMLVKIIKIAYKFTKILFLAIFIYFTPT